MKLITQNVDKESCIINVTKSLCFSCICMSKMIYIKMCQLQFSCCEVIYFLLFLFFLLVPKQILYLFMNGCRCVAALCVFYVILEM